MDGGGPAECWRVDGKVDADFVPAEEDEPHGDAEVGEDEERIPLDEDIDVDIEARGDTRAMEAESEAEAPAIIACVVKAKKPSTVMTMVMPLSRVGLAPTRFQAGVVIRLGVVGVIAADGKQEVASVGAGVPDAEGEIAAE